MRYAAVVSMVLAGCGNVRSGGQLPDAPPANDAAPEVPRDAVVLTVTRGGVPASGVRVYFLDPDDVPVSAVQTDAAGLAMSLLPSGGSVTAIDPFAGAAARSATVAPDASELRTFLGVKPGDRLALAGDAPGVDVKLTAPRAPDSAVDGSYVVRTTCGSSPISAGIGSVVGELLLVGCDGTADMLVLASPLESSRPSAQLYHPGVVVTQGGAVDLTGDVYHPLVDKVFQYTSVPDTVTTLSVAYGLATSRGVFDPAASDELVVQAGEATATLAQPAAAGTFGVTRTLALQHGSHRVIDWGAASAPYQLTLEPVLLPDLLSNEPAFDAATQRLAWSESATGARPDLTIAGLTVTRTSTGGATRWHWQLAAPYAAGELRLPRLPADVRDWAPGTDDVVNSDGVIHARVPGGYDAARAQIFTAAATRFTASIAGASGRVVVSEMLPLQGDVRVRPRR